MCREVEKTEDFADGLLQAVAILPHTAETSSSAISAPLHEVFDYHAQAPSPQRW
jgi:hypothetical protein